MAGLDKRQIPGLTTLNLYRLKSTPEGFAAATAALAARVEAEGERGILGYRFFVNAETGTGRAVVDYRDAAAWIGHHEIAMGWPEMTALHAAAVLEEVTFLGPCADEIREWLAGSGLTAVHLTGFEMVAGFIR